MGKMREMREMGEMGELGEMGKMGTVMVKTYHGVSVCRGGFRD